MGGYIFTLRVDKKRPNCFEFTFNFLPNAFLREAVTTTCPVSRFYKGSPGNLSPINVKRMLSEMALKTTQACEPKAVNSSLFPKY